LALLDVNDVLAFETYPLGKGGIFVELAVSAPSGVQICHAQIDQIPSALEAFRLTN